MLNLLLKLLLRAAALKQGGKVCRLSVRAVVRELLKPYDLDVSYGPITNERI